MAALSRARLPTHAYDARPWQFDLIALSYFLFGASDFTARIPAALFSIATVWVTWHWRRYLGTWGAFGVGSEEMGLASGIAVDPQGFIWVSDAGNNRRMQYTSPSQ